MIWKRKVASLSMVAVTAAIALLWCVKGGQGQTKVAGYWAWGMMGVATGQTLRFNAVSVDVDHEVPVELLLLDGEANVVARKVDRLKPGHSTYLDFPFPNDGRTNRVQLRALVRWGAGLGKDGYLISSMEVIDDATGRTTVAAFPDPTA